MGKPGVRCTSLPPEHIGRVEGTQRTETTKNPKEEKTIVIPSVAASESGSAQTYCVNIACRRCTLGVAGLSWLWQKTRRVTKSISRRASLGNSATEGESPVVERYRSLGQHPSTADHEEFCGNLGEPPPKAKYSLPPIVN